MLGFLRLETYIFKLATTKIYILLFNKIYLNNNLNAFQRNS